MSNKTPELSSKQTWSLIETGGKLALIDPSQPEMTALSIEFPAYLTTARGRSELASLPLVRAMGKHAKRLVDATAGMGQDSFALAVYGFSVTAIERSDKIASLLSDALSRAHANDEQGVLLGDRLRVAHADAIQELGHLKPAPEVIYIDPMYPPRRKKSALAKKDMQVLRAVVGDDQDSLQLFDVARNTASDRVVVKRPVYADPLLANPSMSYESKLVRFDVYLTKASSAGDS